MYERLGDAEASRIVDIYLSTMGKEATDRGGIVVKTIGDEVMCTFVDAERAVLAALGMQCVFMEDPDAPGIDLAVRIGLHFGPVIEERGDVFGDTVNVAARMTQQARRGQIVTTESSVELLSEELQAKARLIDRTPIKGKREELSIYEVVWQQEDATQLVHAVKAGASPSGTLVLRYQGTEIHLDATDSSATLGRSESCSIMVNKDCVSRNHARVERRRGGFTIVDESTNGTYLRLASGAVVLLKREGAPLVGTGVISLGLPIDADSQDVIHFVCDY